MSKSLGNTVDFEDDPVAKYGKIMSIPDTALVEYLELATEVSEDERKELSQQIEAGATAARDAKKRIAFDIVRQFHGQDSARDAEQEWTRIYSDREQPLDAAPLRLAEAPSDQHVLDILVKHGLVPSKARARELARQGALEINGKKVLLEQLRQVRLRPGDVIRVGRTTFRKIVD
jgi:tyrosyl-tRNA synthetase